jgi:hypothetical protein
MIETADFFGMSILRILIYTCHDSTAFNLYRRRRVIWVRSGNSELKKIVGLCFHVTQSRNLIQSLTLTS